MNNHYLQNIHVLDQRVQIQLKQQQLDPASRYCGAEVCFVKGFPEVPYYMAAHFILAYYTPESRFYRNEELLNRAILCMESVNGFLHEDGTVDMVETNFHDCDMNAFCMQEIGPAYRVQQKFSRHTPGEETLGRLLEQFTRASAKAMINCGFGTPNHRWVVSSALALCYTLLGEEACLDQIRKYLNEGIDCDENGEYTERSVGCYNAVCNRSLIIMANELKMPELYDHVERNLNLSMKYFEPDGTLCTMNSTRQDSGYETSYAQYYDTIMFMALEKKNPGYVWLAERIQEQKLHHVAWAPDAAESYTAYQTYLSAVLLLEPERMQTMLALQPEPVDFDMEAFYPDSGVYRYRRGNLSMTLLKNSPAFAQLRYKNHRILFRLAGSFFGTKGQMIPQELTRLENGCRVHFHNHYAYYLAFEEKPDTINWREMDHTKRGLVNRQDFDVTAEFTVCGDQLTVHVRAGDCDGVPVKLEMLMDPGAFCTTDSMALYTRAGDYVFWQGGSCSCAYPDTCAFHLEGGFGEHSYGTNMRGSLPGSPELFNLVCTDFTPMEHTLKITASEGRDIGTEQ